MKTLTPIITLSLAILCLVGAYFYYRQDNKPREQPKIETVEAIVKDINTSSCEDGDEIMIKDITKPSYCRKPQSPEVKPLYVDPKYECKGCK